MIFSKINTTLILAFSVLLTASISNVFSADELCFSCNGDRAITAAAAFGNMKFAVPQEDFEGLDIAKVLDLDPTQEEKIIEAFNIATDLNTSVEISYIYDQK